HLGWAICEGLDSAGRGCLHRRPLAIAPFVIRWGAATSTDIMRERFALPSTVSGARVSNFRAGWATPACVIERWNDNMPFCAISFAARVNLPHSAGSFGNKGPLRRPPIDSFQQIAKLRRGDR